MNKHSAETAHDACASIAMWAECVRMEQKVNPVSHRRGSGECVERQLRRTFRRMDIIDFMCAIQNVVFEFLAHNRR